MDEGRDRDLDANRTMRKALLEILQAISELAVVEVRGQSSSEGIKDAIHHCRKAQVILTTYAYENIEF